MLGKVDNKSQKNIERDGIKYTSLILSIICYLLPEYCLNERFLLLLSRIWIKGINFLTKFKGKNKDFLLSSIYN